LWYKEFRFENFKGINQMTLPLTGGVTTLIGLNESGKTTILEAIFCFSYGAKDLDAINPEMASLRDPSQWIPIAQRANFNETITIEAFVGLSEEDKTALKRYMKSEYGLTVTKVQDEIEISEQYPFRNSRYSGEKSKFWDFVIEATHGQQRTPRRYEDSDSKEWQGAIGFLRERLPRIWYFPNFLFELPERFKLTEFEEEDDETNDRNRFYRSTFSQILSHATSGADLETHVIDRLKSTDRADQRSLGSVLLEMGRLITKTVFEGWDRIFGRSPIAQEVELRADSDNQDAYLELKIKGPDGYYDLSERSLGFRWFFMFLLMTSFQGKSLNGTKPLFLLDEPASNLHSSAQAELLKSFENLIDKCTLVYSTHSHHLINLKWLDSAYVVKNAALGSLNFADYVTTRMGARTSISATKYRRFVAEHPDQTSYFQPVLDLLDYKPSALEPVPNIVLVEGKSDFYMLKYATEVLGFQPSVHLAPGGGASTLDPLIRLYIGWAKSFIILLDGDAEGRKQRDRYLSEFGVPLRDRCFLLPEVCGDSKVKECEGLLSDAEKQRVVDVVYGPAEVRPTGKKALRQSVVELYARKEAVPLSDSTKERFERLLSTLNSRLAELDQS
jgi:predicted ATPase